LSKEQEGKDFQPRIIKSEELTQQMWFRIKIVKWKKYQTALKGEESDSVGRTYVRLRVATPSDTLLLDRERIVVRGLFFELLRFSGGGRKPGYVVAGNDDPITISRLSEMLRVPTEDIFEPLKRLMDTKRVQTWLAQPPEDLLSQSLDSDRKDFAETM